MTYLDISHRSNPDDSISIPKEINEHRPIDYLSNCVDIISCFFFSIMEFSKKDQERERTGFFLSLAYSANLGGTGTIVGSGTNLIVKGLVKQ